MTGVDSKFSFDPSRLPYRSKEAENMKQSRIPKRVKESPKDFAAGKNYNGIEPLKEKTIDKQSKNKNSKNDVNSILNTNPVSKLPIRRIQKTSVVTEEIGDLDMKSQMRNKSHTRAMQPSDFVENKEIIDEYIENSSNKRKIRDFAVYPQTYQYSKPAAADEGRQTKGLEIYNAYPVENTDELSARTGGREELIAPHQSLHAISIQETDKSGFQEFPQLLNKKRLPSSSDRKQVSDFLNKLAELDTKQFGDFVQGLDEKHLLDLFKLFDKQWSSIDSSEKLNQAYKGLDQKDQKIREVFGDLENRASVYAHPFYVSGSFIYGVTDEELQCINNSSPDSRDAVLHYLIDQRQVPIDLDLLERSKSGAERFRMTYETGDNAWKELLTEKIENNITLGDAIKSMFIGLKPIIYPGDLVNINQEQYYEHLLKKYAGKDFGLSNTNGEGFDIRKDFIFSLNGSVERVFATYPDCFPDYNSRLSLSAYMSRLTKQWDEGSEEKFIQIGLLCGFPPKAVSQFDKYVHVVRELKNIYRYEYCTDEDKAILNKYFESNESREEHQEEIRKFLDDWFSDMEESTKEYALHRRGIELRGFCYISDDPAECEDFKRKVNHYFEKSGIDSILEY